MPFASKVSIIFAITFAITLGWVVFINLFPFYIAGFDNIDIFRGNGAWAKEEVVPGNESSTAKVGSEDEDLEDIRVIFLRRGSSLLKKGELELELGIDYFSQKDEIQNVIEDRTRKVALPLSVRVGVTRQLEAFASMPLTYSYREVTYSEGTISDDTVDIGDSAGGISFQLLHERYSWPEIIGTIQFVAPTGKGPYRKNGTAANTGGGHWAIAGGFQFVKTIDPVVLFWGASYMHQFDERGLGFDIQPGDTIEYNFGLSFAANEDLSLSGQVIGEYQRELELDGKEVDGSSRDPFLLRFAVTGRWLADTYLEPSVTFGVNDDAEDYVRVGVALIRRWG